MQRQPLGPWVVLLVASGVLVFVMKVLHLPAAWLLGPMAAGIAVASAGYSLQIAPAVFQLSQVVIGCMIARSMTPAMLGIVAQRWPMFLLSTFCVIAISTFLGLMLTRWNIFPGTTPIWGTAPGAASAMVVQADANGADARLVAVMQYVRVLMVANVASVVTRLALPSVGAAVPAEVSVWSVAWVPFAQTFTMIVIGFFAARKLGIAAGPLLLPIALGSLLQGLGWVHIELPPWLLAVSFSLVGWSVGLRFTRAILVHATRALPWIIATNVVLIGSCGLIGWSLHKLAGVDLLTAYLATSPGGADSIAIIAASGKVDMSLAMAMQITRSLIVMVAGPSLARLVAARLGIGASAPLVPRVDAAETEPPVVKKSESAD